MSTIVKNTVNLSDAYISREWHPTKNGKLTPNDVTTGSGKKVWWQCQKNHEWEATIASRNKGAGCPYCSGLKASTTNNLAVKNVILSREWHSTKNGNLTPYDVTVSSGKRVWWQCQKNHEWEATINHRNRANGSGCPYCSGKRVSNENNLAAKNESLAREWHPTKNGGLTPYDVTAGSHKKVWWQCSKNHEWEAIINNRSRANGTGCPICRK